MGTSSPRSRVPNGQLHHELHDARVRSSFSAIITSASLTYHKSVIRITRHLICLLHGVSRVRWRICQPSRATLRSNRRVLPPVRSRRLPRRLPNLSREQNLQITIKTASGRIKRKVSHRQSQTSAKAHQPGPSHLERRYHAQRLLQHLMIRQSRQTMLSQKPTRRTAEYVS